MKRTQALAAVFFDLDGTLVDSAPDLVAAVAALCGELGAPLPDADAVRRVVSAGGRAMLRAGLPEADEATVERCLPRFLDIYAGMMTTRTRLFAGMDEVLERLRSLGLPWGIVTNKPGWLARPLLAEMEFARASAVLVAGDCLPVRKPDPGPLLHACREVGVAAERAVYVGDDLRDIEAGRAAGMATIAAAWGYLAGGDPQAWGADQVVASPAGLPAALGI